ncbi:MAG: S-adenosylhomocysteine deaminase [Deltaproteobacteria bacterium]|nr:MAG: S-adenosylhomocysteine deaminase [Deltaproteobacteria bacterium]
MSEVAGLERKADLCVKNATIVTMDRAQTIIDKGYVAVVGDSIADVGKGEPSYWKAGKTIDASGGLLLPGLINGHTHVPMSLFRGLADDLPLMEWLTRYIFPVEKNMDEDFVRAGSFLGCAEMILSGTTTFCDMYLFENEVAEAASKTGIRCLIGEVLYDFPSPNYGEIENGFRYTEWLIQRWQGHPLISVAVEPHSVFTCSPGLLERAGALASQYSVPLITHLAETEDELRQVKEKYNKSPVEHLKDLNLLNSNLIADHCVHLSPRDLELLKENGVRVIHNPESNMKLASGIAPVPEMVANGITVGIGTDGCASNNDLDMFGEMDTSAKLHKVSKMDPTAMDAVTVLKMATINGAKALGMEGIIGSIEKGKKADFIVLDPNKPHLTPIYNPYSHIVYAARGDDVLHSIINGKVVMENRSLLTIDLHEALAVAREKAVLVRKWVQQAS